MLLCDRTGAIVLQNGAALDALGAGGRRATIDSAIAEMVSDLLEQSADGDVAYWHPRASGDDPSQYVEISLSVSERAFGAWPDAIRRTFEPARTLRTGKPTFRLLRD